MDSTKIFLLILLISFLHMGFSSYVSIAAESDTLKQGAKIRDWEHLTSAKAIFKLGFFSISAGYSGPNNLENHYLGIWYTNVPNQPVWVANRDSPLPDSSGSLIIDDTDGKLKISYVGGMITVSNVSKMSGNNVGATLLDSGNLVVREVDGNGRFGGVLWQSFDYPTDVLLPGMKLGVNLKTGHVWKLSSWLSEQVPGSGAFELGLDVNGGTNQLVISRRGKVYWTSGVWKNGSFEKAPDVTKELEFGFKLVSNEKEKYFSYSAKHNYTFAKWKLDLLGQIEQFFVIHNVSMNSWNWRYASECVPILENNPSAVCLKENPVSCRKSSDVFVQTRGYFVDGNISYVDDSSELALSDCHSICWKNCSCTAYASSFTDGTGCILYTNAHNFTLDATGEMYIYRLIKQHKS